MRKAFSMSVMGIAMAGMLIAFLPRAADARPVPFGTYDLRNHRGQRWGLRLDELFDTTAQHDVFTFNFNAQGAGMFLTLERRQIHIFGTALGGRLENGVIAQDEFRGLYAIDFVYDVGVRRLRNDGFGLRDYAVFANEENFGTITGPGTVGPVALRDTNGGMFPYSFRFGDDDTRRGHRGFRGISGWGWLETADALGNFNHTDFQDWLFQARPSSAVPEPGTLLLFSTAIAGVVGRRMRQRPKA